MPTVQQILSGSIHLPPGLHFYELEGKLHFHVNKSMMKVGDTKKVLSFLEAVSGPINEVILQSLDVKEVTDMEQVYSQTRPLDALLDPYV